MSDMAQILIAVVGVGVVLAVATVGAAWKLSSRLSAMDGRISGIAAGVQSLNQQQMSMVGLLGTAFELLHRGGVATDNEYRNFVGRFTQSISQGTESYVDHLTGTMNPLTSNEAHRFRYLVDKARGGGAVHRPGNRRVQRLGQQGSSGTPAGSRLMAATRSGRVPAGAHAR